MSSHLLCLKWLPRAWTLCRCSSGCQKLESLFLTGAGAMEAARAAIQALAAAAFSPMDTSPSAVGNSIFPADALHSSSQPADAGRRLIPQAAVVRNEPWPPSCVYWTLSTWPARRHRSAGKHFWTGRCQAATGLQLPPYQLQLMQPGKACNCAVLDDCSTRPSPSQ